MAEVSESQVERAFAAHLGRVAGRADAARDEARRALVRAVEQATSLGWSQRRIGMAIGRSQPEVHRLQRIAIEQADDSSGGTPGGHEVTLLDRVMEERAAVVRVAARYGVANVRLFGSVARGEDRVDSDVDLLVDLDPQVGLFTLAALEAELGEMLGRTVDVVPERSLRPEVAATVDSIAL